MTAEDELYVLARRVCLDALDALGEHRNAVILAGAQAIYLRVGSGDLSVAPFTTDTDLAIDPTVLAEIPPLEKALIAVGFGPDSGSSVGIWVKISKTRGGVEARVPVDLLVPSTAVASKPNARAARLTGHDTRVARLVTGLEGALVDSDPLTIASLETDDPRSYTIRVAGPAALLVAKMHKIRDRLGDKRQKDKDGLDVLRLLRGTEVADLRERFARMRADGRSGNVTNQGLVLLETLFATPRATGVEMVVRAAGPLANADELRESCVALTTDLLVAVRTSVAG